ncbi:MAG: flagellar hook-basal body protein FliE [Thermoleophilia bacterium]|nr:flagellar hook-basal body protein FliE [Thermoleophilia bacterium]
MAGSIGSIGGGLGGIDPFAGLGSINTDVGGAKGATGTDESSKVGATGEANSASGFASMLADKISSLSSQQTAASNEMNAVATGQVDDVAQSMVRIEQANVSLQMATQVRNKVIEAYQEIIRMQI